MRACHTCASTKYNKREIFVATQDHHLRTYFPTSCDLRKPAGLGGKPVKVLLEGLKPGHRIFYFGAMPNMTVVSREHAYKHLQNSGVTTVDADGRAVATLYCPGVYINPENNRAYPRHMHFTYWDPKNIVWSAKLYTHKVMCDVNDADMKRAVRDSSMIILDALPHNYYSEKHIKGAINVPSTAPISIHTLKSLVPAQLRDNIKHAPIVIYCWSPECDAAEKLKEKLDKIGIVNTWHYPNGITGWKGPTE